MKKLFTFFAIAIAFGLASCEQTAEEQTKNLAEIAQTMTLESDVMTPEVLWTFGRMGAVDLSPDKQTLVYSVTYFDIEENHARTDLYTINADGTDQKRITFTKVNESSPSWRPDGQKIGFISTESGSRQLWEMDADGNNRVQISDIEGGINSFKYAPDQSRILYTAMVKVNPTVKDKHPDLPQTSGRIMNDLMYRHWDHWVDDFSHIFVADYDGASVSNATDIMEGEPWESPIRPFGGMEQITWSPDSKSIVYTARKKTGMAYSISTNSDIYQYDLASGQTRNLTSGMMGYDVNPKFSPDGSYIAWQSMERDGYESDRNRLFVMGLENGKKTEFTEGFDQNVYDFDWTDDNRSIYLTSIWHGLAQIYKLDLVDRSISQLTEGVHNFTSVIDAGDKLIGGLMSMSAPAELYTIDKQTGDHQQLTFINENLLSQLKFGKVESRWITTTDDKQMLTWIIYPPNFDPERSYPALLYCQGGPQSTVSQFWSFRWNFQMMAANDYIIVAPNRRGVPGFGQEWNEQISGDYGGQNMLDYLSAIDEMKKEPYIDENRLGAVGASYGGYSVFWLAGNHNKRFKAFIAHNGIFNFEAQYTETEEMWFANWDYGGAYWDFDNEVAQRSYASSPHRFVQNWDTPIMVIHSELDYRIVASQGMSAFNAAVLRGVPAQYLYFPDENHWVLSAQNGILWQRTFYEWLDKWLK
jgi:dipeptidyl aminopeptidase/acylaminoacyl peptidase